jgi:hypothetical protein
MHLIPKEKIMIDVKADSMQDFLDFVGKHSVESDGDWSYEVWCAAQAALFKRLSDYVSQQETS